MHFIYGIHSVEALLKTAPTRVKQLLVWNDRHDPRIQTLLDAASAARIKILSVTRQRLDHLLPDTRHQGVIAECEAPKIYDEMDLENFLQKVSNPLFLILDGVHDPHNLGACLRTADATNVTAVIIPKDRSVSLTPTVCKVACGAAETIPLVQVTNLARTLRWLKENEIWLYGLAGEADTDFYTMQFTGGIGLVLGGEEKGLRRLTREHCDVLCRLPMTGSVSSLNVSVAAAVSLFEVVRQRRS